jgi:hypothetical protein
MGRLATWKDGSDFDTILNVSLATIVVKFLLVILDSWKRMCDRRHRRSQHARSILYRATLDLELSLVMAALVLMPGATMDFEPSLVVYC